MRRKLARLMVVRAGIILGQVVLEVLLRPARPSL